MSERRARRWPGSGALSVMLGCLCMCIAPSLARADATDPLFVYTPVPLPGGSPPPPVGYLEGPCGVAVGSDGDFYLSDYYHHTVDRYSPDHTYRSQMAGIDPLSGPCGLALDSADNLYVNSYHRFVARAGDGTAIDSSTPTGVAVDQATDRVYVDDRDRVAVYEPSGEQVEVGGEPLAIGVGTLGEGYGIAVSGFEGDSGHAATAGFLYVPDAADDTVKVYDPATDAVDPAMTIDGSETPHGRFTSLRDSAVAVDRVSGNVYVADDLQPEVAEYPEAAVWVFAPDGSYLGRLKHNVVDSVPPGLAVDNSATATQGRVYVTSGNTYFGSLYAYGPGAQTDVELPPLPTEGPDPLSPTVGWAGTGSIARTPPSPAEPGGAVASAAKGGGALVQKDGLRVSVSGGFSPRALPRSGQAPISVTVGGRISTTDGSEPSQLRKIAIEFNRAGRMTLAGLPSCPVERIRVASTKRALRACRRALVGTGSFESDVVLAGQDPYPTKGKLLLFNSRRKGRSLLLGQIYAAKPFPTSFVIPFELGRERRGAFGTTISANLPEALGHWGYLTAITLSLSRTYRYRGKRRSLLSAGCPAPKGFSVALFPLARASFSFAGGKTLSTTLTRSCRAR